MADPQVRHRPDDSRFELMLDGEVVGFAEYVRKGGRYIFLHTEIDPSQEGRGLGSVLAQGTLDLVRATGEPVVPLCPFLAAWIERHPAYDDVVDHAVLNNLEQG